MAYNTKIPKNADQLVFAVDIMSFFTIRQCNDMIHELCSLKVMKDAELYRKTARIRYNDKVENKLGMIVEYQSLLVQLEFVEMSENNRINMDSFLEYCSTCKDCFLFDGVLVEPMQLLTYCARLACMACYFFKRNIPEALVFAIHTIASDLTEASMYSLTSESDDDSACASNSPQASRPSRDRADLFTSGSKENSNEGARHMQSVYKREIAEDTSEGSNAGVESLTDMMSKLRVPSVESSCPDTSESDPSRTSEGAEESLSNPPETTDVPVEPSVSTVSEELVEELSATICQPSGLTGKDETVADSKESESAEDAFLPSGDKQL